ncbi:MAG: Gfo/Idh/MocA family oxidoreductase, partial [Chloroflexota bacterium]
MTKVGFIGTGERSISHMSTLAQISDVEIVGIADINEETARTSLEKANTRSGDDIEPISPTIFSDYRAMIDAVDPDCLYLCLPPFVHHDFDHPIIDLGKPIFFEKPIAVELDKAKEIAAHIHEKKIINAVGYQKRCSPMISKAQELLAGLPIGMVMSIRLSGLPGQPWWRVQHQSGGMLVEQHTHAVDMMRVLCGEIETVYAVGNTELLKDVPNLDIFDVNACTVRFVNGAPGTIGNSCAAAFGSDIFPGHLVHVVTQDMMLSVQTDKLVIRRTDSDIETIAGSSNNDDTLTINQNFIEAVRSENQDNIICDYDDGLITFAVTYACQKSAETNQV